MNTGVEAVETAIKLARRWAYAAKDVPSERAEIVVFENNFHGRTMMAVSASSNERSIVRIRPFRSGFRRGAFGDLAALERSITPQHVRRAASSRSKVKAASSFRRRLSREHARLCTRAQRAARRG